MTLTRKQEGERAKVERLVKSLKGKEHDPRRFMETLWSAQDFGINPFEIISDALQWYLTEEQLK